MLQPKVFVNRLWKVLDVKTINFDNEVIKVYDEAYNKYEYYGFREVKFMENTGLKDKNEKYIYTGHIVEILGVYFEIKYRVLKGYVIENKEHTLSLEANLDCVSVVGNIYENEELLKNE